MIGHEKKKNEKKERKKKFLISPLCLQFQLYFEEIRKNKEKLVL